jgi:phospholipid/cholesterol/gamma-HCH transport system permease protein
VRDFGGESFLGGLAASTTLRDVGPVLIGFVLSGKVGAYTSAELATMRVTDQIDALRCLGINPLRQLILPRMIAVVISSFLLLIVGLVLTVFGGMIFSEVFLNVNSTAYLSSLPRFMTYFSLVECIVKSFLFGCFIGLISCREGYFAKGGAEGVGETVRKTAVRNLFCILLSNFLISWMATQIQGAI